MALITDYKNIPKKGAVVVGVIFNKTNTLAEITFKSGKKVTIIVDPKDISEPSVTTSSVKQSVQKIVKQPTRPQVTRPPIKKESKSINEHIKNTSPDNDDYKRKVMAILGEDFVPSSPVQQSTSQEPIITAPKVILEDSESRSTRLAEQLSMAAGGRLESSFKGKDSLSM